MSGHQTGTGLLNRRKNASRLACTTLEVKLGRPVSLLRRPKRQVLSIVQHDSPCLLLLLPWIDGRRREVGWSERVLQPRRDRRDVVELLLRVESVLSLARQGRG